jgi:O-antigen ligase
MAVPVIRLLESRPHILVGIVVLLFVVAAFFSSGQLPIVVLGGITINPLDVICPVLLVLAFPYFFFRLCKGFSRTDALLLLLLLWSLILGFNYIVGLKTFGLQVATNEFRSYFYIICAVYYVASRDVHLMWEKMEKFWLFGAICLFFFAAVSLSDGDFSRGGRPIDSTHTLFILQAMVIGLFMQVRGHLHPYFIPLLVAFFPMLIVLQHRSVWVVMIFTGIMVFWKLPIVRARFVKWGLIGLIVFGGLGAVVFGDALLGALADSYEEAVGGQSSESNSTWGWRLQGWGDLLTGEQMESLRDMFLGNPFGTGWERTVLTSDGVSQVRTESPHNFYLQTLLRSGLIGLGAFLALHGMVIRKLMYCARRNVSLSAVSLCIAVLILAQLVYYIPYGSDYIQAILLGSAISWIRYCETMKLAEV